MEHWEDINTDIGKKYSDEKLLERCRRLEVRVGWGVLAELMKRFKSRMTKKLPKVYWGNTKEYNFKKKSFKINNIERREISLVDIYGNELAMGIEPQDFMEMIQDLINKNMYEYYKNQDKVKGKTCISSISAQ